jgi:hypothetical protein
VKLIWRGQILKDNQTLREAKLDQLRGRTDADTLHAVVAVRFLLSVLFFFFLGFLGVP